MTIQEAIKTGKKFKRETWGFYYYLPEVSINLREEDILADDWKVEEAPFLITELEIFRALRDYGLTPGGVGDRVIVDKLKEGYYK